MRTTKASKNETNVNISYWETDRYLSVQDLVVVGSGIVGLFTALNYKKQNPKAKVTVLERGVLPFARLGAMGGPCSTLPWEQVDSP